MGESETKFGPITETKPTVMPSVVSFAYPYQTKKPKYTVGSDALKIMKQKKKMGGESDTEMIVMNSPVQNGRIMNKDQAEEICRFAIENAKKNAGSLSILMTSDPLAAPTSERQDLCEMLMEKFAAEQVMFEASGVLNMRRLRNGATLVNYSNLSGLSVSSGVSYTSIVPVLNNKPLYNKTVNLAIGGSTISAYLHALLKQSGFVLDPSEAHRVAEHVKKNMAYCSVDIQKELQNMISNPREYTQELELGTGEKLVVSKGEAFKCAEVLFNPELVGDFNSSSMQKAFYDIVENNFKQDSDKRALYGNIILSGGNSLLVGLKDRLSAELKEGLRQSGGEAYVDVVNIDYMSGDVESESITGPWEGGRQWILDASQGKCQINWITKKEFAEQGKDRIIKAKCY
jgi:actin-related protein